jgi:hypothetical protein
LGAIGDHAAVGHLLVGNVDLRLARALQAAHRARPHDADDRAVEEREAEAAAERILPGQCSAGERVADDRDERRVARCPPSLTSRPARSGMPSVAK